MSRFLRKLRDLGARFRRDRTGMVVQVFGLTLLPLVFAAGAAIDYSFASRLSAQLQAASDTAVLRLCQLPKATKAADLQTTAQKILNGFLPDKGAVADPPLVKDNPRQITITTHANHQTAFIRVMGTSFNTIPLTVTAGCEAAEHFFEIALVLDTTGSMATSDGKMKKIDALEKAATDFVKYMYEADDLASHTKIALVPFSAAVAVEPTI